MQLVYELRLPQGYCLLFLAAIAALYVQIDVMFSLLSPFCHVS